MSDVKLTNHVVETVNRFKKSAKKSNRITRNIKGEGRVVVVGGKRFIVGEKKIKKSAKKSVKKSAKKSKNKSVKSSFKKSVKKSFKKSVKKSVKKSNTPSTSYLLKLVKKYGLNKSGTKTNIAKRIYSLRSVYLSKKDRSILENFLHMPKHKKEKRSRKQF
jgi:hypothetical protein